MLCLCIVDIGESQLLITRGFMEKGIKFRMLCQDILSTIVHEGKTGAQICIECDIAMSTFKNYLAYMREKRLVHICGWRRTSGNRPIAMYKFGFAEDVELIRKSGYVPKASRSGYETVTPKIPRCDIAAAWMLNPIEEDVCQN
jgi:predicted transcriptional regulator